MVWRLLLLCCILTVAACGNSPSEDAPLKEWGGPPSESKEPEPSPNAIKVLFVGNSHTGVNDVPGMVRKLLATAEPKLEIATRSLFGGHLDDVYTSQRQQVIDAKPKYVVLQGAMISSSHTNEYSLDKAIELAKLCLKGGAQVLYYAEWPQKGLDESEYIHSHYRAIAKGANGGNVLPICWAWDSATAGKKGLDMWQADGNHAQLPGSYIAACTIAYAIAGPGAKISWTPDGVDEDLAKYLRSKAKAEVDKARAKKEL